MENATKNWEQMTYPFFNLKLNYALDALEPSIDSKTMRAHYELILESYIKKLNEILESRLELQNMTLSELYDYAKVNQDNLLSEQVGGVYNHFFYFTGLRPSTGQIVIGITPQATQKITSNFGGWKEFKQKFAETGLNLAGSGCVWLIKNHNNGLEIITTTNQNIPENCTPVLCLDIWEHAYFCKHLNSRQAYIDAFWNIIDWVKFSEKI